MTRIRPMNADDVERILVRSGFELVCQKGSHRKWRNLPMGTLRNIMVSANIPETEWKTE